MSLSHDDKMKYHRAMTRIVQEVGELLRNYSGEITDMDVRRGHEFSTLDAFAGRQMLAAIDRHLPDFDGTVVRELNTKEVHEHAPRQRRKRHVIISDELEGTTNYKRKKCSENPQGPVNSSVTMAFATDENLGAIEIGAVYSFFDCATYSAFADSVDAKGVRYLSLRNGTLMDPRNFEDRRGDDAKRLIVVGYSNKERKKKAEIEAALVDEKFRIYDGCRSSTNDVLNMLADNQFDAYIDPRALWPGSGAMLQAYDIAGAIPIAVGCGFVVSDIFGENIGKYGIDSTIPIVIARPAVYEAVLRAVEPVVTGYRSPKVVGIVEAAH